MSNLPKLRMGLVGCGGQGTALAEAIACIPSLQLVACADPNAMAANHAATLADNVSTHGSIEAMLAECEVDAIIIATPHHLLQPITITALQAGKHVMTEKPTAMNEREAAEIEGVVAKTGLCYMAGYSFRFLMGRFVHELLQTGAVGDIYAITSSISMPPLNHDWLAYPETGGGPLLFVGCHLLDLILWYMDDTPTSVYADLFYRQDTGADNTTAFQVHFSKGAIMQCLVTQAGAGFFYEIAIRGTQGQLILRGRSFLQFELEISSKAVAAYSAPTVIRPPVFRDHIQMMLVPELEEFASAIREKRTPMITAADARMVLKILDAVIESARCGQPIALS
ncbi:MAG: Gfo/Idh/MocA family oxidoreductase [Chloroflexi bacterium]|nr:Gfo/Idh/MocA family oxidoreductase [Chloroflexota bacterium]MCC6891737.1 Gfo/Idh/MocA family oxidoreductase [Anaerolineae bacterium]